MDVGKCTLSQASVSVGAGGLFLAPPKNRFIVLNANKETMTQQQEKKKKKRREQHKVRNQKENALLSWDLKKREEKEKALKRDIA